MNTIDLLNKKFSEQDFPQEQPYASMLNKYREMARSYAQMENAIAVLSDLRAKASYIYYGGFAQTIGIGHDKPTDEIPSIWEKEIFNRIHPDDLARKHLQELCFFHFIKQQPKKKRTDYYLASKLRMKTGSDHYIQVLHRMFYIPIQPNDSLWLALCLYTPLTFTTHFKCVVINTINGYSTELETHDSSHILSAREKQILNLIEKGLTSKDIANLLSISTHTVSRHRQEILNKLQVKNSIEACRIAKDLQLI